MTARNDNENAGETRSRSRAGEAYETARTRTYTAYEAARGRATDVTRQAADQIAVYPVAAVVGGIAIGALLGFLLPRTRQEEELLAPTGRRITEAAREAAQRGLDAGKQQVEEIRSKAAQKVGEAVVEAVGGGTNSKD
jgi:ElaB/YqjD/DUF883 family membrane-anchored ribosome-binding protein